MTRIEAKVARLIEPDQVALNVGALRGVAVGDKAVVYRQYDVSDPDTSESLGSVYYTRLNLRINFVADRFCIGATTDHVPTQGIAFMLSNVTGPPERMRVTDDPANESRATVLVKTGDTAYVEHTESVKDERESQPES
jgi:hypothetical protein